MNPGDLPPDLFSPWEGAVAFRLFADQTDPTLTVSEQIAARVGDRILSGAMAPGARIGEQELADEFAVSRGPIRDALRILEREGLATLLPRRGAIVTELSADELRELLEIRAGLFEMVVRKIAAQPNLELLAMLEAGVARLETLAVRDGLPASPWGENSEAVYLTSCFVHPDAETAARRFANEEDAFVYSRFSNPNVTILERRLAALEGMPACIGTGSGMGAITLLFMALQAWVDKRTQAWKAP